MATQTKVIGPISAYAIAVQEGYTGSKSEWAEAIGNAQTYAQTAVDAAAAVQGLVESLPEDFTDLNNHVNRLDASIGTITGNVQYADWAGPKKYIPLNVETTDVNNPVTQTGNCQCMVVPAAQGDTFTITAKGGTASRAYGFVASDGTVLSADDASKTRVNYVVTADNALTAYLVVNDTLYTGTVYSGVILKDRVAANESAAAENRESTDSLAWSLMKEQDRSVVWQDGAWNSSTGNTGQNPERICSKKSFDGLDYIVKTEAGVLACVLYYDGSTYKARSAYEYADEIDVKANAPEGATNFMLNVRTEPVSDIEGQADVIGSKVHFYSRREAPMEQSVLQITDTITTGSRNGITFTRKSANKFSFSGTPSSTSTQKIFNVFNGNAHTGSGSTIADFDKNIFKAGTYRIQYETDAAIDFTPLFYTTAGFAARVALNDGDTFTVTDGTPVCLYAVSPAKKAYASEANVTVYMYYTADQRAKGSAVDYAVRGTIENLVEQVDALDGLTAKWGVSNILANARQMYDLKFTPVRNMPKTTLTNQTETSYFPAGTEVTGVPYSSARAVDKMVGINLSLKTFMSAVQNPKSVLYTRRLTTPNANTYYGAVCSVMVADCYKTGINLTTQELYGWDGFDETGYIAVEVGDCLVSKAYGHAVVVIDLTKDRYGRISRVVIAEELHPVAATKSYTYDEFKAHYTGQQYKVYRYKKYENVDYTPVPYVKGYADEEDATPTYPDIMSEFGDDAVFLNGDDVVMNIVNADGYSAINLTKDGEPFGDENMPVADFTIENAQGGLYVVTMTGTGKQTQSRFFVVDGTCAYNSQTHIVTFSSSNATPEVVHVYNATPTNKAIVLTDADRDAGQIDVSDYIDSEYMYVKVTFKTDMGTATWYSYDLHQWVPFGE